MSLDAFRRDVPSDNRARCREDAIKTYMGLRRKPRLPDEKGALWVVEQPFDGGRLLFTRETDDWFIVTRI